MWHSESPAEYNGYRHQFEVDREDDNIKIFHSVITPEGKEVSMDWSPYYMPTDEEFQMWVDLGCPRRITSGPLNRDDLVIIAERLDNERARIY